MKAKKGVLTALMSCVLFVAVAAMVFAAPPAANVAIDKKELNVQPIALKADPLIEEIYSMSCACKDDLGRANAMMMNDIWVTLFNGVCPDGKRSGVKATLKVSWFDLSLGRMVEQNVLVNMGANSRQAFRIMAASVLVKKSTGIKAEIVNIQAPVTDCNPANNVKTVTQCNLPPIY